MKFAITIRAVLVAAAALVGASGYSSWLLLPWGGAANGAAPGAPLSERAGLWVITGLDQAAPLPVVAAVLVCADLVLIQRWHQELFGGNDRIQLSRWDGLQLKLCAVAVATTVLSVVFLSVAVLGLTATDSLLPLDQVRSACLIVAGYCVGALCLTCAFFVNWWHIGIRADP